MKRNSGPLNEQVVNWVGWKTPTANDSKGSDYSDSRGNHDKPCWKLPGEAKLAGWGTSTANEPGGTAAQHLARKIKANQAGSSLGVSVTQIKFQAELASWPTPTAKDASTAPSRKGQGSPALRVVAKLVDSGPGLTGSTAETKKSGQLNPDHSRWLMGLPAEWLLACPADRPRPRYKSTGTTARERSKG
jgi:hypothetical protein